MESLRQRQQLKAALAEAATTDTGDVAAAQLELTMHTTRCKRMRRQQWRKREAKLTQQINEEWQRRQFAQTHRHRVQLTANGKGPKKRNYFQAHTKLSKHQWQQGMGAKPEDGGMQCTVIDYEVHEQQQKQASTAAEKTPRQASSSQASFATRSSTRDFPIAQPIHPQHQEQAAADLEGMIRYLKRAPKRRATPEWGLHAEVLLAIILPTWRSTRRHGA